MNETEVSFAFLRFAWTNDAQSAVGVFRARLSLLLE